MAELGNYFVYFHDFSEKMQNAGIRVLWIKMRRGADSSEN